MQIGCCDSKKHLKKRSQQGYARKSLLQSLGLNDSNLEACHKCVNDSSMPNGFVCQNPNHLYLGTHSDNFQDRSDQFKKDFAKLGGMAGAAQSTKVSMAKGTHVSQNMTKEHKAKFHSSGGRAGSKAAMKNGNHSSQQMVICPHCGKSGNKPAMGRWHFDKCRHRKIQ